VISFPPCKINLGLNVLSKRADGYHDIETCFYPVPLTDILEIIPSNLFSFSFSGEEIPGKLEDNLCLKAYQLLKSAFPLGPVKLHLHKTIPMGAGLGGGSSDAAHTLLLLNQVFHLEITREKLQYYASQLGSDCTFFIQDHPQIGTGKGEILTATRVNLKGYSLVLVKPATHVLTANAYANISVQTPKRSIPEILNLPLASWKENLVNDFEKSTLLTHPIVGQIKQKLYSLGARYACMSGSGSSVFGIFEKPVDLRTEFTGLYYWSGELN
jgi:4-diphosphocytidyl-2-C-methyl-D-erythritol kinase